MAWWTSFGSQSNYGEPSDLCKHDLFIDTKQTKLTTEPALDKGNTTPPYFTIFPDDRKSLNDGQKSLQKTISLQTSSPEYHAHIDLGFSQSTICAKYPPDQCYSPFSTYGSQVSERFMLPMATDDGPIFVNPKQYHGIMRRRKSRAKAVLENRSTQKRKQPFMHLSRHLHAMRRPRGTGGRFLNSKSTNNRKGGKEAANDMRPYQPTGSQSSEVLQSSNSGTLNSSKEGNSGASNHSATEVTSLYSRRDLDRFSINHLAPPIHNFSVTMTTGHSIVMPTKWVATADNCYNLNV